ncbi:toxin VasX [Psychrobacter aquimaris]|uniref:toxin VasX n=1 Tax=Psychrobacter aquimaris TaxID=292733 RepID=UPI003FD19FB1
MSSDLSFMDRLTSEHKNLQRESESVPVVSESHEGMPSIELDDIVVMATKKCDYECGKTGIPILPVVFSKTDYKVALQDERYFPHNIVSTPSSHTAVASLPTHAYLYCYIENSEGYSFDEYYTGSDGALKYIQSYSDENFGEKTSESGQIDLQNIDESDSDSSDEDVQPFTCSRKEHSTLDSKYITLLQGDTAWLMVSHAKLTKSALKRYVDDETLRNKRMQKFVADELTGNKHTVNMNTNEVGYIKSFSQRKQLAQGGDIKEKINVLEKNGNSDVSGSVIAASSLYQSMQRSIVAYDEDITSEIKPMMVALPDPVGEVIAAAERRNYLLSQLSELSEDRDYTRKIINALIIKNLEKSSIKTTQFEGKDVFNWGNNDYVGTLLNIGFSDTDPEDLIFKHINKSSYESYLQSSQKIISLKKEIVNARKVFVKAITSEEFKFIIENDFDIELVHDEQTAKDFEAMIASCIAGCGIDDSNIGIPQSMFDAFESTAPKSDMATEEEFKKALLPQLSNGIEINENWLLKVLGGLDKELIEIFNSFHKQDRASEATGAGIGYISEKISVTWLNKITVDNKRSALENKDKLIKTLSQNLLKLSFYDPKAFRALYKTLELSIYGHAGVVLVPRTVTATVDTMASFANFALGIMFKKSTVNKINERARQARSNAKNVVETVTDTTIVRTPQIDNLQQAETKVLYYFEEAYSTGKGMDALSQLNDGQLPIDLDKLDAKALAAEAIQWHNNVQKVVNGGMGVVSGFIAYFQLNAVIASMPSIARLKYAGDPLRLTQEQLGTVSSGLALVTASMDVAASSAGLLGKTSFANKLVYRAGWLGVVGAMFEVGSLAIYGYRKLNDGNKLSFGLTFGAGVSISASAVAGLIYGYGVANAATGGAAAIPGAALLGIMMVGMTLSYVFQRLAYKYDDKNNTLIEYWLDNSVFGHKAMRGQDYYLINPFQSKLPFNSLEQDISGFITACTFFLANNRLQTFQGNVPVEHEISTNSEIRLPPVLEIVKEHLTLFESQIHIGNWDKASQLTIEVVADKNGREQNLYKAIFHNSASDEPAASNVQSLAVEQLSPKVTKKVIEEEQESKVQFVIETQLLKFEPHDINKAKVIVTYTPDTSRNPSYPLKDVSYLDNNKY